MTASDDVKFENENLILVDKSATYLTTPARDPHDARPCLGRELQARLGRQIYPVHRLDFGVSGLVLFAKTADAHREANRWFENALVGKRYEARGYLRAALAAGASIPWTLWVSHLVRGKKRSFEAAHGKRAETRARLRADGVWELEPITGRPHQLRFEMAKHDHPICGDVLYGAPALARTGIALRAVRLDFARINARLGLPEMIEIPGLDPDDEWR